MKIFTYIDKVIDFINRYIAAIGISGGVAIAFTNVVARYAFDASLTWASELTTYLFLWSVFFGAAYCFKKDAHIAINILVEKVSPSTGKFLMLISYIITLVFLCAISYYGYEYLLLVHELEETSIDLELPMWIIYLVIPVSFAFGAIHIIEKIYVTIKTPAKDIVHNSESKDLIKQMDDHIADLKSKADKLVKDANQKTGGML
jgi:C4-dicarboxylate transporter DctQ subunit